MNFLLIAGLTAGTVSTVWSADLPDDPMDEESPMDQPGPGMRGRSPQGPERDKMRMHPNMNHERMQQMRAERDEIMRLGEAARNETDPAKKEKLVGELRSKLSTVDDQIHEMHQARLEQAEKDLVKLRERMEQAEENREQRIDNMVERILSKEPMGPRDGGGRMRPDHGRYPDCPPPPPIDE
jgi:hypothetical protein